MRASAADPVRWKRCRFKERPTNPPWCKHKSDGGPGHHPRPAQDCGDWCTNVVADRPLAARPHTVLEGGAA